MLTGQPENTMTPKHLVSALFALALPLAASAHQAITRSWVNLRAGPAPAYPLVARVGPNTAMQVQGCTAEFGWCDVIVSGEIRGWVYAGSISIPYRNASVPVIRYGALIGIPIVTFVISNYWGTYYRDRPWYGSWQRWEHRRPPPRPAPVVRRPPRPAPVVRPPVSTRPPGHPRSPAARPPTARPPTARAPTQHSLNAQRPGPRRPPGAARPGEAGQPDGGMGPQPR
jgi:uncharacterized protein YraI